MEFNKEVGKYLENDGVYITGGIIESREDEVLLSFAQNGFEVKERFEEKGWLVFVVKKKQINFAIKATVRANVGIPTVRHKKSSSKGRAS